MVPVLMLKVADEDEAAMVADAGTARLELLLARLMVAPPDGAACDRLTVQMAEALAPSSVGVQDNEEIDAGATRFTVLLAGLPL
jgi:hypothetical protein